MVVIKRKLVSLRKSRNCLACKADLFRILLFKLVGNDTLFHISVRICSLKYHLRCHAILISLVNPRCLALGITPQCHRSGRTIRSVSLRIFPYLICFKIH